MAIIRVEIFKRTQEVRDAIIKGITEVMVANGAKADGTEVIIYEIDPSVWGRGGKTYQRIMDEAGMDPLPPDGIGTSD